MARFLLVHGSSHGGWCWRDLVPALATLGHETATVDLPSVAQDPEGLAAITLDDDARTICANLDRPTVLVGHSAAGFAISRAAALAPGNVAALVFLCAYVPRPGATLAELRREAPGHPLDGALEIDRPHRAYRFLAAALETNLYPDCPAEVIAYARPRLGWQAIGPQAQALAAPPHLPAHYIVCAHDRTIPPVQQRSMAAGLPGVHVHEIASGHSPFFAAPGRLADILDGVARQA